MVRDLPELRDRTAVFVDRAEAGRALVRLLEGFRAGAAVVLAIPAGGVPVGAEIAAQLGLSLDVAPVSKMLLPWTTESGFGAVAFDGSVWVNRDEVRRFGLSEADVERAAADARAKVERRLDTGRIVIAVPTGSARSVEHAAAIADEACCANLRRGPSFSVADAYER